MQRINERMGDAQASVAVYDKVTLAHASNNAQVNFENKDSYLQVFAFQTRMVVQDFIAAL